MPIDERQLRFTFQRLGRQLTKVSRDSTPENVHHLRTYTRRVEVVVSALSTKTPSNDEKLLKTLARIRKKAGRVRDLDVQLAALGNLDIQRDGNRKAQLIRKLAEEREGREKKLSRLLAEGHLARLRKRLKKAAVHRIEADPLELALSRISELGEYRSRINEKTLHQYRIVGKRGRYLAEFAVKDARSERLIESLKRMQDAIGDWHDWLKLEQQVREAFSGSTDSQLLSTLRRTTATKFGNAVQVLNETRATILGLTARPVASAGVASAAKAAVTAA